MPSQLQRSSPPLVPPRPTDRPGRASPPLPVKLCVCLVLAACFLGAHALLFATLLVLLRVDRWSVWNVLLGALICGGVLLSMVRTCAGVVRRVWHRYLDHQYQQQHQYQYQQHLLQQEQQQPLEEPSSPTSSSPFLPPSWASSTTTTTTTTTTGTMQDTFSRHMFDLLLPLLQWVQSTRRTLLSPLLPPPPPPRAMVEERGGDDDGGGVGDWTHFLSHLRLGMLGRELSAEDYEDLLRLDEHDIEARHAARGLGIGELRRLPLFRIPHSTCGTCGTRGSVGQRQQQQQQKQMQKQMQKQKGMQIQEESWGSAVVVDPVEGADHQHHHHQEEEEGEEQQKELQLQEEEEEEEYDILTRGLSIADCGEELGAKLLSRHCPICLLTYCAGDVLCTLPLCLHRFHFGCVARWLQMNDRCPVCQQQAICLDLA